MLGGNERLNDLRVPGGRDEGMPPLHVLVRTGSPGPGGGTEPAVYVASGETWEVDRTASTIAAAAFAGVGGLEHGAPMPIWSR